MSHVSEHAPDIKSVTSRLQEAIDAAWKTPGQSRYTEAHVLLLRWEDDDLRVAEELKELGDIFALSYKFSVETWNIPHEKPTIRLQARMAQFLQYERSESLLIVYYAGHAAEDEQRNEPPVWTS